MKLPDRPNLEHLNNQAEALFSSWTIQNAEALRRLHPFGFFAETRPVLNKAQFVIAREYGFTSWSELKRHVESLNLSREESARKLVEIALIDSMSSLRQQTIRHLLKVQPDLDSFDLALACMLGNVAFVETALKHSSDGVHKETGFARRPPLLYATFSWFLKNDPERKPGIRQVVKLLLENGADPNASYLHGKSSLSALYGSAGVANDPEIVQLLVASGANVNDGESLYHCVEHPGTEALEQLFTRELSDDSKAHAIFRKLDFEDLETVRWLLNHGIDSNLRWKEDGSVPLLHALKRQRTLPFFELLLEKGANPNLANNLGTRPFALAQRLGRTDVAELLLRYGAKPQIEDFDAWIISVLAGAAGGLPPPDFRNLNRDQADILSMLAGAGNTRAVEALLDAGMPVDLGVHGTPLHWACWNGMLDTVRSLVRRGAPLEVQDHLYHGAPMGWTLHGSVNCRKGSLEDYVSICGTLADAGAPIPSPEQGWWQEDGAASPEIQAWLFTRT